MGVVQELRHSAFGILQPIETIRQPAKVRAQRLDGLVTIRTDQPVQQ
jgi:hypothetical protein